MSERDGQRPALSQGRLRHSFGYAFFGIWTLVRTQRNARIHLGLLALALVLGAALDLSRVEWIAVALAAGLVLSAEACNTAIEALVDLVSPALHPLAKRAKDIGAGAVLLAAIAAAIVGLLVYVPHLLALVGLF